MVIVSEVVVSNLTAIYVALAVCVKAYGLSYRLIYGGFFVLIVSMMVVGLILIGTLAWDISHKLIKYAEFLVDEDRPREVCTGGICWHGAALQPPPRQFRLRSFPQHIPITNADA